jgi:hypothetical protein
MTITLTECRPNGRVWTARCNDVLTAIRRRFGPRARFLEDSGCPGYGQVFLPASTPGSYYSVTERVRIES